jgi:hypothetical protein
MLLLLQWWLSLLNRLGDPSLSGNVRWPQSCTMCTLCLFFSSSVKGREREELVKNIFSRKQQNHFRKYFFFLFQSTIACTLIKLCFNRYTIWTDYEIIIKQQFNLLFFCCWPVCFFCCKNYYYFHFLASPVEKKIPLFHLSTTSPTYVMK